MDQVAKKTNDDPLKVFKKAIENVKPVLEVKTRRVGGANYQVPVEVNPFRRAVAGHSLAAAVFPGRAGKTMIDKLADELDRRGQRPRRRNEEEGRRAPHGGSQQGLRALPLVRLDNERDLT